MRNLFIMVMLLGLSMAFSVKPDYFDTKETGNQNLDTLEVDIELDCDSKVLTATVTANDTGEPIPNSSLYLFYTDYEYQLIGNGMTGSNGVGTIDVIGNMDYLTAMFIFRADKFQFRSKEIEFGYAKCFGTPPKDDTPANHTPGPSQQNTTPPANGSNTNNTNAATNNSNANNSNANNNTPPSGDGGQGNGTNQTASGQTGQNNSQPIAPLPDAPDNKPCLAAFLLPLLAILAIMRR